VNDEPLQFVFKGKPGDVFVLKASVRLSAAQCARLKEELERAAKLTGCKIILLDHDVDLVGVQAAA
jgi:hypothetical protein